MIERRLSGLGKHSTPAGRFIINNGPLSHRFDDDNSRAANRWFAAPVKKPSMTPPKKWLSGLFPRRSSSQNLARHDYKRVWNLLSTTETDAKVAVAGHTEESVFRQSAVDTLRQLQGCVGVNSDDIVLEIGAGVGRVGAVVAPLCKEWIGTDVSENMVGHIRERLSPYSNVRVIATSGFDLAPIPSNSIDLVYCTVVFMHLDEWDRYSYVLEALRVLKPGGRFYVDNINLMGGQGWALFEAHRAIVPNARPAHISKTSTPQELQVFFSRAGFANITQIAGSAWLITHATKPLT